MTRKELSDKFIASTSNNFILQLPTSYGKTLLALQKINQWYDVNPNLRIIVVIPRLVLEDTWKEEINKFKFNKLLPNIRFITYVSLPKLMGKSFDVMVFDECHHTSERCRTALQHIKVEHVIGLSATIKRELLQFFKYKYKCEVLNIAVKDAIESEVLPDPKVIVIPIKLDNTVANQVIEKKSKRKGLQPITINYQDRRKYRRYTGPLRILCTQQQYYEDLSTLIDWYKQQSMHNAAMKNSWLHKAGDRLKWLAKQKEDIIKSILKALKNYRVLTFCQSIKQSESLGCPCVNSKIGTDNLDKFNNKEIKHIASIDMLNEGLNPIDCKVGLFQMLNSSQRISIQRSGRILRHKEPVLIFPYFINSREQEIIMEILKDYNPKLITKLEVKDIKDIKKYL